MGDDEPDSVGLHRNELAQGLIDLIGGRVGSRHDEDGGVAEQGRRAGIANEGAAIGIARDDGHLLGTGLLAADRRDRLAHGRIDERALRAEGDRDAGRSR